jgi:internalin A
MTEKELLQVIEQPAREGVTELDLSGEELTALPPEIGKLTHVQYGLDKTLRAIAGEGS